MPAATLPILPYAPSVEQPAPDEQRVFAENCEGYPRSVARPFA